MFAASTALVVGVGGVARVRAATAVVTAVADGSISSSPIGPTYLGNAAVRAGGTHDGQIMRALFRFDLSEAVPVGAVVRSATITMQVTRMPDGSDSVPPQNSLFELHRVLQGWDEVSVSWNERSSGVPWTAPGASAAGDVARAVSSSAFVSSLGSYTFGSSDALVADIQAWVNAPGTNFGWLLQSQGETTPKTARLFASREAAEGIRPTLSVTFDPPVPATPPVLTVLPVANGQVRFSFSAEASRPYVVEARDFFWRWFLGCRAESAGANVRDGIDGDQSGGGWGEVFPRAYAVN